MSTHASVRFVDKYNETEIEFANTYIHSDGYIEGGVGNDLGRWLKGYTIVNGIGMQNGKVANGTGCLAAQFVKKFKTGIGGVYMAPPTLTEEYDYKVVVDSGKVPGKADDIITVVINGNEYKPSKLATLKESDDEYEPIPFS